MTNTEQPSTTALELSYLDALIIKYAKRFIEEDKEPVKIGDLLKMIELKRKLSPADAEQKKFWKMLDRIRKENLEPKENKSTAKEKRKKQK